MSRTRDCCRCNRGGRCRNCSCRKNGSQCSSCLPGRLGRCVNQEPAVSAAINLDLPDSNGNNDDRYGSAQMGLVSSAEDGCTAVTLTHSATNSENGSGPCADVRQAVHELPPYDDAAAPNFIWGEIDGETLAHSIDCCYEEIVHWRRNLFKLPSGKSGKSFVREMSRLFRAFGDGSAMERVALKAAMVLPALLLQKPHAKSKAKDHCSHLERRLKLWEKGDINSLVIEGRTIQRQRERRATPTNEAKPEGQMARTFAKLMMEGKVKAALRLLAQDSNGGVLPMNNEVIEALKKKHPARNPAVPSAVTMPISSSQDPSHFILFDQLDGQLIRETALKTERAAGPSGLDTAGWKRLCTSFQSASSDL